MFLIILTCKHMPSCPSPLPPRKGGRWGLQELFTFSPAFGTMFGGRRGGGGGICRVTNLLPGTVKIRTKTYCPDIHFNKLSNHAKNNLNAFQYSCSYLKKTG